MATINNQNTQVSTVTSQQQPQNNLKIAAKTAAFFLGVAAMVGGTMYGQGGDLQEKSIGFTIALSGLAAAATFGVQLLVDKGYATRLDDGGLLLHSKQN